MVPWLVGLCGDHGSVVVANSSEWGDSSVAVGGLFVVSLPLDSREGQDGHRVPSTIFLCTCTRAVLGVHKGSAVGGVGVVPL